MKRFFVYIFAVLISSALIWPELTAAQSLIISDCQGFTRSAKQVDPGTTSRVEIQVETPPNTPVGDVQVTLTNTVTGEVQVASAQGGLAVFDGVTPGLFTVATEATGVQIAAVTVSASAFGAATAGAVALGAGLSGGAAVVGASVEVANAVDNNKKSEPTPTPLPTNTPAPKPTAIPTPQPTPTPECPVCDPEATPPSVDPFEPPDSLVLSPSS